MFIGKKFIIGIMFLTVVPYIFSEVRSFFDYSIARSSKDLQKSPLDKIGHLFYIICRTIVLEQGGCRWISWIS